MAHSDHPTQNSPFSRLTGPTPSTRMVRVHASQIRRPSDAPEGTSYPYQEELIVDDRAAIGPAQMVEDKLARILKDSALPVSHLLMRGLLRAR